MNDMRRLNELRNQVRASYYCCRRELALVSDPRLRAVLERAAFARWRLARSIDAYLVSQPAESRSHLHPTLRDLGACLALRAQAALASNRDLHGLRWLADDSARLRHAVEISRALTWSLDVSDFLSVRLDELKQVQRSVAGLMAAVPGRSRTTAPESQGLAMT
jgi:hypothetical protein